MRPFHSKALCASALLVLATACAHGKGPASREAPRAQATPSVPAAVETREVSYQAGATKLKGMIAYPSGARGKRPGVLVVHEWWGLDEYARSRASQLAGLGYVALAVDMFGEGKHASHPEDAKRFAGELMGDLNEAMQRFEAARALLAGDARVDGDKIAAIGYCMGGAVVLHAARLGADLDAVASFHGNLAPQAELKPGAFEGQILVAHGGSDAFVPPEQLAAFEKELERAGVRHEIAVYPSAKHGFTNPAATGYGERFGLPLAYDAEADADSWRRLEQLLAQVWD